MSVSRSLSPLYLLLEHENQATSSSSISTITVKNIQNCCELPAFAASPSIYTQAELQAADALLVMQSQPATSAFTKNATTEKLWRFKELPLQEQNELKEYICNFLSGGMTYERVHSRVLAERGVKISIATICRIARQKGFKTVRERKIEQQKQAVFEIQRNDPTQSVQTISHSLKVAPKTVRKWLKESAATGSVFTNYEFLSATLAKARD